MGFFIMAIKTTLEQLEEVQEAISALMSGQEITIDGKKWVMADLSALEAREDKLLARYHRENGGGLSVNYGLPRRD